MPEYLIQKVTVYRVESHEGERKPFNLGTFDTEAEAQSFIAAWKEHDAIMGEFA